jgi:hypothetical protein
MVPFYWKRNKYYCCGFRVPCVASVCGLPIFIVPSVFSNIYFIFIGLSRTGMKPTIGAFLLLVVVVIVW